MDSSRSNVSYVSGTGAISDVGSGFSSPMGLFRDADGDLWVADNGNKRVVRITAATGAMKAFGSGLLNPTAVFYQGGRIFILDGGSIKCTTIYDINLYTPTLASGFSSPTGLVVDANYNQFTCEASSGNVYRVDWSTKAKTTFIKWAGQKATGLFFNGVSLYVTVQTGISLYGEEVAYRVYSNCNPSISALAETPDCISEIRGKGLTLTNPVGVSSTYDLTRTYVADLGAKRVYLISYDMKTYKFFKTQVGGSWVSPVSVVAAFC